MHIQSLNSIIDIPTSHFTIRRQQRHHTSGRRDAGSSTVEASGVYKTRVRYEVLQHFRKIHLINTSRKVVIGLSLTTDTCKVVQGSEVRDAVSFPLFPHSFPNKIEICPALAAARLRPERINSPPHRCSAAVFTYSTSQTI